MLPPVSVESCLVCGSKSLEPVFERRLVPVHQNRVYEGCSEAVGVMRGDLQLVACAACGLVFNARFESQKLEYGPGYESTQMSSPAFREYVDDIARFLVHERNVRDCHIVEVGSGKGDFLELLVGAPDSGNTGVGFDPSYVGPSRLLDGRLCFYPSTFDGTCAEYSADVVLCRHVVAQVNDPLALLQACSVTFRPGVRGRLFIETPCAERVLREVAVWDLFYEYHGYFSADSLAVACARSGFRVEAIRYTFGGQYLLLEAIAEQAVERTANPQEILALARNFSTRYETRLSAFRCTIQQLARSHKLAVWGAGARGTTFVNLVDLEREYVACLVDINPAKQGKYVAGTGHAIIAPNALKDLNVTCVLLLNPNYAAEVQAILKSAELSIDVLDPTLL